LAVGGGDQKKTSPQAAEWFSRHRQPKSASPMTEPGAETLRVGEVLAEKFREAVTSPGVCYWCHDPFEPPKLKRFVILDGTNHSGGWGLVSICFECWKCRYDAVCEAEREYGRVSDESGIRLERVARECKGCGEPVSIPAGSFRGAGRWFSWCVCSNRCYQRAYRKRRRHLGGSSIDWKGPRRDLACEACKKRIPREKRGDAKFCSNRCRQLTYRRRHHCPA
jgi:hypothetical protein